LTRATSLAIVHSNMLPQMGVCVRVCMRACVHACVLGVGGACVREGAWHAVSNAVFQMLYVTLVTCVGLVYIYSSMCCDSLLYVSLVTCAGHHTHMSHHHTPMSHHHTPMSHHHTPMSHHHTHMSQVIRRCRCENVVFLYAGVGACAHEQVIRGDVRVYVCRSLEVVNYFVIKK